MTNTRSTSNGTSSTTNIRSSTGMYIGATRTNVKPSLPITQQQLDEENTIQKILNEFIIPFRKGEFCKINSMNTLHVYIDKYLQTKTTNIVHNLILESISAAMFSKFMKFKIDLEKKQANVYKTEIQKLEQEISIFEALYREQTDSGTAIGVTICARAEVEPLDLLPFIAQCNIKLAWYYFINGADGSAGIDFDSYNYVNQYVDSLGESKAREELLKLL